MARPRARKSQTSKIKTKIEPSSTEKAPQEQPAVIQLDIDRKLGEMQVKIKALEKWANQLRNENGVKTMEIKRLSDTLAQRDRWIKRLQSDIGQKDARIKELRDTVAAREKWIQSLKKELLETKENRKTWVNKLHEDLSKKHAEIIELREKLAKNVK